MLRMRASRPKIIQHLLDLGSITVMNFVALVGTASKVLEDRVLPVVVQSSLREYPPDLALDELEKGGLRLRVAREAR